MVSGKSAVVVTLVIASALIICLFGRWDGDQRSVEVQKCDCVDRVVEHKKPLTVDDLDDSLIRDVITRHRSRLITEPAEKVVAPSRMSSGITDIQERYRHQIAMACHTLLPRGACNGFAVEQLVADLTLDFTEMNLRLAKHIDLGPCKSSNPNYAKVANSCKNAWLVLGETMITDLGLRNTKDLVLATKNLSGGFMETGVWRGGTSIYARKVMEVFGLQNKHSFVCDSFQGLPAPRTELSKGEEFYSKWTALTIPEEEVRRAFEWYGVMSEKVHFYKGFFVDTMPVARQYMLSNNLTLSVLRLDGDMYESTIDVLYNMYDLVDIGGFVIVDDYGWAKNVWMAKYAVLDFRKLHGIEDEDHALVNVDGSIAFWQKVRHIEVKRNRYPHNVIPDDGKVTPADAEKLRLRYEPLQATLISKYGLKPY